MDENTPDLQNLVDAILFLANKVESQQERIDDLEDLLCNQVIGGIKNLYHTNLRTAGIESLKGKYGSKIEPFGEALPSLGIKDWSSELYDKIQEMKGEVPDWDDDHETSTVESLIANVQDTIDKIAKASGAKPVAASVTVAEPTEAPADEDEDDGSADHSKALIETAKRLRGKK